MYCDFQQHEGQFVCSRCGVRRRMSVLRVCGKSPQIGDAVESFPTSYGITKEWSDALKANNSREPVCLHDAGDVGVTLKVECSCSASGEKGTIVHICDIASIRRCLPNFHPNKKDRLKWHERKPESDIYQLCDQCEHFRMKDKP